MKTQKLILEGVLSAVGVFIYVSAIAWILNNGERLFGKMTTPLGPTLLLMIFILSATITGSLVLGRPAYLFLNGSKQDAIKLFFYTFTSLLAITAVLLVTLMLLA